MKLFISYSGDFSKAIARVLAGWIPTLFNTVEPFVAEDNTQKGAYWFQSLRESLDSSQFGILCLAADNLTSEWLLFEAGALCTRLGPGKVWPVVFGVKAPAIESPLSHLQYATFDRDGMKAVMRELREYLPEPAQSSSSGDDFNVRFNKRWSYLHKEIRKISPAPAATSTRKPSAEQPTPEPAREPVQVPPDTQDWPPLFAEALATLVKLRDAVVRIGPSYRTFVDDFREETRQLGVARKRNIQASVIDGSRVLRYHDQAEHIGERARILGDDGLDRCDEVMHHPHGAVFWSDHGSNIGLAPGFARSSVALFTTCGETGHRLVVEAHEECSINGDDANEAWYGWKRRQIAPAVASLDARIRALMAVRLERVEVVSFRTTIGSTLRLKYSIDSPSSQPIEAWLGAEIECSRNRFFDVSEDKAVTLASGRHEYERTLTVPPNVLPGQKLLTGGLWVGEVSNAETSLRLAIRSTPVTLTQASQ